MGAGGPFGKAAGQSWKGAGRMNEAEFRDHLNRLKAACNAPEIAVDMGLRRKGSRFFCPSCQPDGGKSPDLSIRDAGFACFKCGAKGDIIDLIVLAGSMSNAEAIAYLEARTGIRRQGSYKDTTGSAIAPRGPSWKAASPEKTVAIAKIEGLRENVRAIEAGAVHAGLYDAFLKTVCQPVAGSPGAAYLEGRGIAADLADRYGVRYCADLSELWTLTDRKVIKAAGLSSLYVFQKAGLPFLVFPYIRQGLPVFIKTRCLLSKDEADRREIPRFLNTGGLVPCLWNHDAVAGADEVLITEGEIDALSAIVMGFAAVGLPGWSHWKDAWTKDFIGKDVFLVLDADAAGQKGTADIAKRFMKAGLPCPRQLTLTEGQDLNDALHEFMKDGKAERMTS
jgi:DNA primase